MFGVLQDQLQHVLADLDPVDLSHVMWAVARLDSYPAPGLLDALLATLPPQISSAEPAVCCPADWILTECTGLYGLTWALQLCCRHGSSSVSSSVFIAAHSCVHADEQSS